LNPDTEEASKNDGEGFEDPETFWEMMLIVVKLSIGPIISMFFYMFV